MSDLSMLRMALKSTVDETWEYYAHTLAPPEPIPAHHGPNGLRLDLGEAPGGFYVQVCEICGPCLLGTKVYGSANYADKECTNLIGDDRAWTCEACLLREILATYGLADEEVMWEDCETYWYVGPPIS